MVWKSVRRLETDSWLATEVLVHLVLNDEHNTSAIIISILACLHPSSEYACSGASDVHVSSAKL